MGRPSLFTAALADEICERIANGETLRAICRDDHMPHWTVVYDWTAANEAFSLRIARARVLGYDAIAEETLEILDEPPERCATEQGDKVDTGYVQWQKNRAEQRLKLLAKWDPKRYGEKIDVTSGNESLNLTAEDRAAKLQAIHAAAARRKQDEDDGTDLL